MIQSGTDGKPATPLQDADNLSVDRSADRLPSPDDDQKSTTLGSDSPFLLPPLLPPERGRGVCTMFGFAILLITAYFGCMFCITVLLPCAVLAPGFFRSTVDTIACTWLQLAEIIIARMLGVRVRQFGDRFSPNLDGYTVPKEEENKQRARSSLILLNHSTQLDWFFIWGLGNPAHRMKVILKDSMSKIPGVGWAMQAMSFLFLRRRIASDQSRIDSCVKYLLKMNRKVQFLLFPEGTNFCARALASSSRFAMKNNLPLLRYTLHPRRTGFTYLVNLLGKDELTDVYDVTVGYPDHFPAPEYNTLLGQVPREVHFHVRRYSSEELPWGDDSSSQEERFGDWLRERWLEKEDFLKAYYARPIGSRCFENEVKVDTRMFGPGSSHQLTTQAYLVIAMWTFLALVLPYTLACKYLNVTSLLLVTLIHGLYVYFTVWHGSMTSWVAQFA